MKLALKCNFTFSLIKNKQFFTEIYIISRNKSEINNFVIIYFFVSKNQTS